MTIISARLIPEWILRILRRRNQVLPYGHCPSCGVALPSHVLLDHIDLIHSDIPLEQRAELRARKADEAARSRAWYAKHGARP